MIFNFLYYLTWVDDYFYKFDLMALPNDIKFYLLYSLTSYEVNLIKDIPEIIAIVSERNYIQQNFDYFIDEINKYFN